MAAAEAVGLMVQLLEGLAYAHAQGVVHRDVKPSNLLLTPKADPATGSGFPPPAFDAWHLKLADFGLARAYQDSTFGGLTVTGTGAGTPPFMPPEQVRDFRGARPASDQYAAAATLYYLLSGRFPHEANSTGELLRRILEEKPTPVTAHRPDLPPALAAAVHRGLSAAPADRYPDVTAFAAALREAVPA